MQRIANIHATYVFVLELSQQVQLTVAVHGRDVAFERIFGPFYGHLAVRPCVPCLSAGKKIWRVKAILLCR